MKLACVLTACTIDPGYYKCLPLFIRAWRTLYPRVKVKVVFVHETVPPELEPYCEHVIHFPPVEGIPVAFQSQYIRLLYPALLGEEGEIGGGGVMITDIDLAPMNRRYFSDSIRRFADDAFVNYQAPYRRVFRYSHRFAEDGVTKLQKPEERTKVFPEVYLPGNTAAPKVWAEVFGVQTAEDVPGKLLDAWKKHYGKANVWFIDQIDLALKLEAWDSKTRRYAYVSRPPWCPCRLSQHPDYVKHKQSPAVKSSRFISFLFRLYVKSEIFADYQMCANRHAYDTEEADKTVIGYLSSRPLPRWIMLIHPLIILAYKGVRPRYHLLRKTKYVPFR